MALINRTKISFSYYTSNSDNVLYRILTDERINGNILNKNTTKLIFNKNNDPIANSHDYLNKLITFIIANNRGELINDPNCGHDIKDTIRININGKIMNFTRVFCLIELLKYPDITMLRLRDKEVCLIYGIKLCTKTESLDVPILMSLFLNTNINKILTKEIHDNKTTLCDQNINNCIMNELSRDINIQNIHDTFPKINKTKLLLINLLHNLMIIITSNYDYMLTEQNIQNDFIVSLFFYLL
jgi:hypothetical protein